MDLWVWVFAFVVVAPAFALRFALEAARRGRPGGGLPARLGAALLPFDPARWRQLGPAARLWGLKGFFIPVYALSLNALVGMALDARPVDFGGWLLLGVTFAYTIDLAFALSGYLFASNDLAPTVRSTQTRLIGWIACLMCYGPVFAHWPEFKAVVLAEITWPTLLTGGGPLLVVAAALMLVLLVLYVSATVCFGLRFCNLTNRGLISNGPYRLMKHPAYFAHVGNAWLLRIIFLPAAGVALGPAQLLVPVAFTVLYWLRAVTEEQHMGEDPDYRAYAAFIARHGLLARARRLLLGLAGR